jgi:hypothetical protein
MLRAKCLWLTPVILSTREAEAHRFKPAWAKGLQDPYLKKKKKKKKHHKKRAGEVTQGVGPEFKLQYHKKNKQTMISIVLDLTIAISMKLGGCLWSYSLFTEKQQYLKQTNKKAFALCFS